MIDPRKPDFKNTPISADRPRFGYLPREAGAAPIVSIVTPFFNTGDEFLETAACIFGQSFQQFEWIIINDCSTDPDALRLLDRYRALDPRVRVIDQPRNQGPSAARNVGFAAARAPFVFQQDSDDLLEPTAIEKMLWYLATHRACAFVRGFNVSFGAQEYLWKRGFHDRAEFLRDNLSTIAVLIRKSVFEQVCGYDETLRDGLEDWDFWLRCAANGHWGSDIPEFFDWYRKRSTHGDRWSALDGERRRQAVFQSIRARHQSLTPANFPLFPAESPRETIADECAKLPVSNRMAKRSSRALLILPWLRMGGADKFNLDFLQQATARGWEITIATTLPGNLNWMSDFGRHTPDIFALHNFLPAAAHAQFLRYLIESRQPDVILVSNSEFGYRVLPYLRSICPGPAYVDYNHMEEEQWKGGGYPRYGVACQKLRDLNIVASQHLKNWMVQRGADVDRAEVATINVDPDRWRPDEQLRISTRQELSIASRKPVILYAGRLCPQKRPKVFAETMRRLAEKGADFVALVAGDGEDRAWLEEFVAKHRLSQHVRLRGEQSIEEMRNLILASDIFFLPSEWEGIALSIYEAMAAGLAVVGADVGGQRELVTPECGVLVPRTDVETETGAYVVALEQFLSDEVFRRRAGENARLRIIDHFALKRMGDRMVELLGRAIYLSRSAPREHVSEGDGLAAANDALEHVLRELEWAARTTTPANGSLAQDGVSPLADMSAESELWSIENSRAWRTIQRAKENPIYRVFARLRWGPDWDSRRTDEPVTVRLARLKSSNAFRIIQAVKRTPMYRWYAVRKYGSDWKRV